MTSNENTNINIDENKYKEIGELYIKNGSPMVVGPIKSRNPLYKNKSLLSPDSDRLLYNYSSNVEIDDFDISYEDIKVNKSEKQIFIGKNIITVYDTDTGNFYVENPHNILLPLMKGTDEGGLGLTGEDLNYVCENLRYVIVVDELAYILSTRINGTTNAIFTMNLNTLEIKAVTKGVDQFINKMVYCKPIVFNKNIYFLVKNEVDELTEVYSLNTVTKEVRKDDAMSEIVSSYYQDGANTRNSIVMMIDRPNEIIYFIGCTDTNSVRSYSYKRGLMGLKPISDNDLNFLGRTIKQYSIYDDPSKRTNQTYMILLLDNNSVYFVNYPGNPDEQPLRVISAKYEFIRTHGVLSYCKVETSPGVYGFYILLKKSDSTVTALYFKQSEISSSRIIDATLAMTTNTVPAFIKSLSEKVNITNNYCLDKYNIIIGNYEEAGMCLPLIKDFGKPKTKLENPELNRSFRTVMDKDNGVSLVKGLSYGNTQMSRIRLHPEDILNPDTSVEDLLDKVISLRESVDDRENYEYTTGSYIWKLLNSTGMPYNTHVDTIGRIIVDGFDIPIEKTMITKANGKDTFGDVLFTFDKLFDISILKDALADEVSQYPGVLFFKNNGFLQNAIISNSYVLDGSIFYDDATNGKLFDGVNGIHSITCSCKIDDRTLLIGTNFGGIASVNIQTGGFCSITGKKNGDNPPSYYNNISNYKTDGCVSGIVTRNNKVFVIFSSGKITESSTLTDTVTWKVVKEPEADKPENIYIKKVYEVKDNLLLVSMVNGGIFTFDMDSETYVVPTIVPKIPSTNKNNKIINASVYAYESSQLVLGNRIYYMPTSFNEPNYVTDLCWYDYITNSFGSIDKTEDVALNNNIGGMIVSDDIRYIYIISNSSGTSQSFVRYDTVKGVLKPLANLPLIDKLTFTGAYVKNQNVYVPFGIISGKKYILEYVSSTNTWITHLVMNSESIKDMYNSSFFKFKDNNNNTIFRMVFGKKSDGNVTSASNLCDYCIDINTSLSDIENSVTMSSINKNVLFYGSKLYYDEINNKIFVSGGNKYHFNSEINSNDLCVLDRDIKSIIDIHTSKIKKLSYMIGTLHGDSIFEIGGKVDSDSKSNENAFMYDTRLRVWKTIYNIAHYGTKATDIISSMKVIGDGDMLVISYSDGSVGSIDLRDGTFIPQVTDEPVRSRCVHRIFAKPGEFSDEGATSINEVGDDVIFNTPSRTFRWSTLIGAFFKGDDKKYLDKYNKLDAKDKLNLNINVFDRPIAGSSKINIGKYIVFLNGYDNDDISDPTAKLNRSILAYDTEYEDYTIIANGKSDMLPIIDGTIRLKYNAYSYYANGYIYTFGGIFRGEEMVQNESGGSVNVRSNKRTGKIERYDLITGEVIELKDPYGFITPYASKFKVDSNEPWTFVLSTVGRKETRVVTPFSQTRLFEKTGSNKVYKNRYLMGITTMGDVNEKIIEVVDESESQTKIPFNTTSVFVFDTYTEEIKNTRGNELDSAINLNGDEIVIPIERYGLDVVDQYLAVYSANNIKLLKMALDETGKYKFDTVGENYVVTLDESKFDKEDFRRGITVPFYDERSDMFVFPDVHVATSKGSDTIVKNTVVFDFIQNKFSDLKQDTTHLFNPDSYSNRLYRLNPVLSNNKKIYRFDDIMYRLKTQDIHDITSSTVKHIVNDTPLKLFIKGIKDPVYTDITKDTGIVSYKGIQYKAALIYSKNTEFDDDPRLGAKDKTRLVVLKNDPKLGEVVVSAIEYPKGMWTDKSTNVVIKTFVCDDLIWFIPKLGVTELESTTKIPDIIYSYNPYDDSLVSHAVSNGDIPSGIHRSNIVVDNKNKIAHILYGDGGDDSVGFNIKDIKLSGISQLSHVSSSPVEMETISEKSTVSTKSKNVIVNGTINNDGSYRLIILLLGYVGEQLRIIEGNLLDNDNIFNEGDEFTANSKVINRIYSDTSTENIVNISCMCDDGIVVTQSVDGSENNIFRIYDEGHTFKDEYIINETDTLFTEFENGNIKIAKPENEKLIRVIDYKINSCNVVDEIKTLKNVVNVKDYDLSREKEFAYPDLANNMELFKSNNNFAIYYSNINKCMYKYTYKNKILEKIFDFNDSVSETN